MVVTFPGKLRNVNQNDVLSNRHLPFGCIADAEVSYY